MRNTVIERLDKKLGSNLTVRRYALSDMISESYRALYDCDQDSNLRKLVESHLDDVRRNPKDIERLSRQLSLINEVSRMIESNQLKDEDLVDKKHYDTPAPRKERVIVKQEECNEASEYCIKSSKGDYLSAGARSWVSKDSSKIKKFATEEEASEYLKKYPVTRAKVVKFNESTEEDLLEDTELTEEEVDELQKHLAEIRKNKKLNDCDNETQENCEECDTPVKESKGRKLVRRSESTSENVNEAKEAKTYTIVKDRRGKTSEVSGTLPELISYFSYTLEKGYSWQGEKGNKKIDKNPKTIRSLINNLNNAESNSAANGAASTHYSLKESSFYDAESLKNFSEKSKDKAFYKTFKKMHESLKEGKALTRQESMNLYKAANSAMTQLSVELEHNPEFLETFKECTDILSADVTSLLESMKRGKAPSKKTMKSLSKFSEVLLNESEDPMTPDEARDYWEKNHKSDPILSQYSSFDNWYKDSKSNGYIEDESLDEAEDDEYEYFKKNYEKRKSEYETKGEEDNNDFLSREEKMRIAKAQLDDVSRRMKESTDEDEDLEAPEDEEFVSDEEGDIHSEESEEFDQEYADARVELHQDIAEKHGDSEDLAVQEKISKDAEEVLNLDGITDDQIAEITGEEPAEDEESPEDEEMPAEESPVEDNDEITDDELEELKRHLTEMRKAKRK